VPEPSRLLAGNRHESGTVRSIATRQDGIVARSQLLVAGVGGSAIHRALRSRRLHRIHRGVYSAVAPELLIEDGRITAALLAAGEGALLSHGTAAWRWRIIPAAASVMQSAVPRRRTAIEGLQLFVSGRLRAGDTTHGRFPTQPAAAERSSPAFSTSAGRTASA
jgi:hypothetical protein